MRNKSTYTLFWEERKVWAILASQSKSTTLDTSRNLILRSLPRKKEIVCLLCPDRWSKIGLYLLSNPSSNKNSRYTSSIVMSTTPKNANTTKNHNPCRYPSRYPVEQPGLQSAGNLRRIERVQMQCRRSLLDLSLEPLKYNIHALPPHVHLPRLLQGQELENMSNMPGRGARTYPIWLKYWYLFAKLK